MSQLKSKTFTKKEFKKLIHEQTYVGYDGNKIRINAFFFDWKQGRTADDKYFGGYKWCVYADVKDITKQDLFNLFYDWTERNEANLPWYVNYKCANTDTERFKVPLSTKGL